MKPCEKTEYINATIRNVGTNPAKIFKLVNVTSSDTGLERYTADNEELYSSEPEYMAEMDGRIDDIHSVTDYSLSVEIYENETNFQNGVLADNYTVHELEDGTTVADIEGTWMYFGDLEPGQIMVISQDYHLQDDAGNEYQGDAFTFDVTFGAAQLNDDTTFQGTWEDVTPEEDELQ